MKKISIWLITVFAMMLTFTSCEVNEEFETCPEINLEIENEPGSAVYRFIAQLDELEDIRFTWTIDDEEIATGNIDNIIGQILDYRFEPGKHTVCVKVASDDCPIQVCKEIDVVREVINAYQGYNALPFTSVEIIGGTLGRRGPVF